MTSLRTETIAGSRFEAIPRVLHQTWKSEAIPPDWKPWRDTWLRHHPDWEHRLWTDADNRRLVAEHYPFFLPTYDAFPREIQRVDAAKYFILHHCGGVYADLDTECLQPLDGVLSRGGAVLSRSYDGVIDCAVLISAPGHDLWPLAFEEMGRPPLLARMLRDVPGLDASHVLFSTGPQMMRRALRRHLVQCDGAGEGCGVTICRPEHFSGRTFWRRDEAFPEDPAAFVRHHYRNSWLLPLEAAVVRHCTRRKLLGAGATLGILAACAIVASRYGSGA